MGNQTTLWVRDSVIETGGFRRATREELVAALSQIDGAEPDIEAALECIELDGFTEQTRRVIVEGVLEAALAGRLVIPVGEEPNHE